MGKRQSASRKCVKVIAKLLPFILYTIGSLFFVAGSIVSMIQIIKR
jgi:hypothetical protein